MIHTTVGILPIGEIVRNHLSCEIVSFNHETGAQEAKRIEAYETNPGRELVEIDLGDRVLRCTEDHQIYVEGRGYIQAIDLQPGDIVTVA